MAGAHVTQRGRDRDAGERHPGMVFHVASIEILTAYGHH